MQVQQHQQQQQQQQTQQLQQEKFVQAQNQAKEVAAMAAEDIALASKAMAGGRNFGDREPV